MSWCLFAHILINCLYEHSLVDSDYFCAVRTISI
uniref:Uncharacterized protein n=1 Tax=Arundo donax TaxID=35708 RepID=A0A0A9CQB3_ARUDO